MRDDIRAARVLYSIRDLLGLSSNVDKIVCPIPWHPHHQNTPSCSIFVDSQGVSRFECHGACGEKGDVIDLAGKMMIPGYDDKNPEHIKQALALLAGKVEPKIPEPPKPAPMLHPRAWELYTPPGQKAIEYAARRGINRETMEKFRLGQTSHYLTIPAFEDGVLQGIKMRNMRPSDKKSRFFNEKGSKKTIFNIDACAYSEEPFLFVKGEIPAMVLDQRGLPACGLTGGESSLIERWKLHFSMSKKIVVVGDNDLDPSVHEKMAAKAKEKAEILDAELRFPPKEFKDIDDWVLADPGAIDTVKGWLYG